MNEVVAIKALEPIAGSGPIYLDHHATTPVDSRVLEVVVKMMAEEYGNANGVENIHGERAARAVADAKETIARILSAEPEQVHFTAGSTEAIQLAISHAIATHSAPLRVAMTRVEHKAVIDTVLRAERLGLVEKSWIEVDENAQLDWQSVERVLTGGVDLICVMAANNEVGTIYPVRKVTHLAHHHGALVLVDATQAIGRMALDLDDDILDYIVLSAHKIYGPKGVGALVSASFDRSSVYGLQGAHNPTPNVAGAVAMGHACRLMELEGREENERLAMLRDRLQARLISLVPDLKVNGDSTSRLPHNLHLSAAGAPNDIVLNRLRGKVSLSTGSACNAGAQEPSHVLQAMGLPSALLESCLRIGLGRSTTLDEVERAAKLIAEAINEVRHDFTGGTHV